MNRWKMFLACLCIAFSFSGCIDGNDPENLEYIITMGVDLAEDGYEFTFVPAKTRSTDTTLLEATGSTLSHAISQLNQENPRKTEIGQLKMIVLSKEVLLEDGYLDLLAEWERSQDISGKVMLLATEESAKDCMSAILEGDGETGLFLWDFYENTAKEVAVTWGEDLDGFLSSLGEQRDSAILPKISVTEGSLSLGGGLLLQNHVYAATLDGEDALGYAILCGESTGAVLAMEEDGKKSSMEIMGNTVSYDTEIVDGQRICAISIAAKGDVLGSGREELFGEMEIQKAEELFAEGIKTEVEHTIEGAREAGAVEALGIGAKIRQQSKDFWDIPIGDWQLFVEVSVDLEDFGRIR